MQDITLGNMAILVENAVLWVVIGWFILMACFGTYSTYVLKSPLSSKTLSGISVALASILIFTLV